MKGVAFFYLTAIVMMGLIGVYIYFRVRPLMALPTCWQGVVARVFFVILMASFFIGYILQSNGFYLLSAPFTVVGSWMFAAILYLVLGFLLVDVVRLLNLPFHSDFLTFRYSYDDHKSRIFSLVVCSITAIVMICGYFVARHPITKNLTYQTDKNISQNFKFVLVSDIHLGMINCDRFFSVLKDRINLENPDFVVIAGDFFDGDPNPVMNSKVGEMLKEIRTGCGVYAVTGNHEYIGDADAACDFLRKNGVVVLRDSSAILPFGVTVIGRDDLTKNHIPGQHRQTMDSLLKNVDSQTFELVLDHQPARDFSEYIRSNVDLVLSGHTHAGAQLWPMFLITSRLYENDFGQLRKGNTDFYTTSGYGTWGPPIRTSARPEMVVIDVVKR